MSPENLYFILWLREYKQRYMQWKSQTAFQSPAHPPLDDSVHYSSHLAMFYARAKQTFFTPGSAYELNLASTLLDPFHRPTAPPYPPPDAFRAIELDTYRTLDHSLRRFVNAQLNNVGNRRVLCGIIAGIIFCIIGALVPLAVLFAIHAPRWTRLAALPGLWIGMSVLCASVNGICLGVYIFGDLRQLRKFELARPPISKPKLLPTFRPIVPGGVYAKHGSRASSVSSFGSRETAYSEDGTHETNDNIHISPAYYDADSDIDPMDLYAPTRGSMEDLGMDYQQAGKSNDSAVDLSTSINTLPRIVGPSGTSMPDPSYPIPPLTAGSSASPTPSTTSTSYTATATFIHPFDTGLSLAAAAARVDEDEEDILARAVHLPARHQIVAPFDFEGLPLRPGHRAWCATHKAHRLPASSKPPGQPGYLYPHQTYASHPDLSLPRPPEPAHAKGPRGILGIIARMQERGCSLARWRLQTGYLEERAAASVRDGESPAPHRSSPYWVQVGGGVRSSSESEKTRGGDATTVRTMSEKGDDGASDIKAKERTLWKRLRAMRSVPAFRVPLARVLSPVVVRGQWEIVVRSMVVALILSATVVAALLAVPV
ncbi:hypothetical protein BDN70DRAFT_880247 [Pholiota conissans]|uniref:Uncharacterized protein n=1 Tax=Pholiota conissans TaxID=109636 RepID=A0A9P6CZ89_9AGAR|nr:hypothetical protein BDN70DRAFT_880247 [Pholiota conissans]